MDLQPLKNLRVLQLSGGIEVAYCAKLLVDIGADVVVVEPELGHELRRRSATGSDLSNRNAPIFDYLFAGVRSVIDKNHEEYFSQAQVILTDRLPETWELFHAKFPHLSVVAITPFGLTGPWADRPACDLTLQALSGGMAPRGGFGREPLMVGGEPSYWFAGAIAAVGLLGVLPRALQSGVGELIDVSMLESTHVEHNMHPITFFSMAGRPFSQSRGVPVPGIEPTLNGWVGFFVITGQQWHDFCSMIEHPEWHDDKDLFLAQQRRLRSHEIQGLIREWTRGRTTEEIVEFASLFRIPVAAIGTGETIPQTDHFEAEKWFVQNAGGFVQPRRPYRSHGEEIEDPPPSPLLGGTGDLDTLWNAPAPMVSFKSTKECSDLPLAGLKVADFTSFWAGPLTGQILGGFGADVVHIEGPHRPDGIRMNSIRNLDEPNALEWSPLFCGTNTNKRGLTIDLSLSAGKDVALRLLATCDVMIENFSPRVIEQLGLSPKNVLAVNPQIVIVRMPAFGLDGPWRDRVGFAQTIEQSCGLASLTGYQGEEPVIPNGMGDPLAGVHAAIAVLAGLLQSHQSGKGQNIEASMIGSGLATAAEQVVEFSAFNKLLTRAGNKSPTMLQDVYKCRDEDDWVAIGVYYDSQEQIIEDLMADSGSKNLSDWCSSHSSAEIVATLWPLGIAVAPVVWAHQIIDNPQLIHRRFFETLTHPICGTHPYVSYPAIFSAGPKVWNRFPSPTMGQHNFEILGEIGFLNEDISLLVSQGVLAEGVQTKQQSW